MSGELSNGELIGTMSVRWGGTIGAATITKLSGPTLADGTFYYNQINRVPSPGVAGNYTLGTIPGTPLTVNIAPEITIATIGLATMFLGVYLYMRISHEKKFNPN